MSKKANSIILKPQRLILTPFKAEKIFEGFIGFYIISFDGNGTVQNDINAVKIRVIVDDKTMHTLRLNTETVLNIAVQRYIRIDVISNTSDVIITPRIIINYT